MTIKNPAISAFEISQTFFNEYDISISPSSINNYRNEKLNFDFKIPKIRQELSESQMKTRYLFSNSVLANKIDVSKIIFSDESRFCLLNDGNMRWIKRGDKSDNIFFEKGKYVSGIMVYGAIGKNYKSELVICENSINDVEYRHLIEESKMIENLGQRYSPGSYFFMQDGAPAHKSHLTTLYLKKRNFNHFSMIFFECNFLKDYIFY